MATLQELRNMAARRIRDEGFTALVADADYTDAVNEAQSMLAEILKCFITATSTSTVASVSSYDLSDRFMGIYPSEQSVLYTDSTGAVFNLYEIGYDKFIQLESMTGTPTCYVINNDALTLYPTPDYSGTGNLIINTFLYPTELVDLTDDSDFHAKYNYVISYFAASLICEWYEDYEQQKRMYDRGMLRLNSLISANNMANNGKNVMTMGYFGS